MIWRDLSVTMAGIGAGQAILLLAMPLLARMYGPAAFGTYAVIVSVAGIVATIAALRIDLAIGGASDEDVAPLTRASLVLPFLIVPVMMLALAFAMRSSLAGSLPFGSGDLSMIGLIAFFQGLVLVGSGLSTRFGAFRTLAAIKIAQPLIFAVTALLIIKDLPLAMAIGWVAALAVAVLSIRRIPLLRGWRATRKAFAQRWRYPVISAPMALLNTLTLALPLLTIASAFGDQAAGNYSQVQRLIGAPLVLVATAGGQTFLKHAGDQLRAGRSVMPLLQRFVLTMTGLAFLVTLAVALVGDPVLQFLVGPAWRTDTGFLILALLPVLWRVIASPVSLILVLTDDITTLGLWQFSQFLVTAVILFGFVHSLGFEWTLGALAISDFILYGIYLFLSVRAARRSSHAA